MGTGRGKTGSERRTGDEVIFSEFGQMTTSGNNDKVEILPVKEKGESFLRKQAWDYFNTHASQRMDDFQFLRCVVIFDDDELLR